MFYHSDQTKHNYSIKALFAKSHQTEPSFGPNQTVEVWPNSSIELNVRLVTTSLIEREVLRLVKKGSFEKVTELLILPYTTESRYSYLGNYLNNLHGNT